MLRLANSTEEEEDLQSNGTLADLLLTMVAVILLILVMLLPHIDFSPAPPVVTDQQEAQTLASLHLTQNGVPLSLLVITQEGLHLSDTPKSLIATNEIPNSQALQKFLTNLRDTRQPLLLMIASDGLENAFQLEPILAVYQPLSIQQVRLDKKCQFAKEAVPLRACQQLL